MRPIIGKEARARRRRGRVKGVRGPMNDQEREMLEGVSAFYNPDTKEIVANPGVDDSVIEHEMIHAEQFGPLAALLNADGRVQDRSIRRAARRIALTMDPSDYEALDDRMRDSDPNAVFYAPQKNFSPLKYMIDDPIEFEAILRSALSSKEAEGLDFSGGFDDVSRMLDARGAEDTNTNLRLLRSAMREGNLTDKQKKLFLRAIQSNLRS